MGTSARVRFRTRAEVASLSRADCAEPSPFNLSRARSPVSLFQCPELELDVCCGVFVEMPRKTAKKRAPDADNDDCRPVAKRAKEEDVHHYPSRHRTPLTRFVPDMKSASQAAKRNQDTPKSSPKKTATKTPDNASVRQSRSSASTSKEATAKALDNSRTASREAPKKKQSTTVKETKPTPVSQSSPKKQVTKKAAETAAVRQSHRSTSTTKKQTAKSPSNKTPPVKETKPAPVSQSSPKKQVTRNATSKAAEDNQDASSGSVSNQVDSKQMARTVVQKTSTQPPKMQAKKRKADVPSTSTRNPVASTSASNSAGKGRGKAIRRAPPKPSENARKKSPQYKPVELYELQYHFQKIVRRIMFANGDSDDPLHVASTLLYEQVTDELRRTILEAVDSQKSQVTLVSLLSQFCRNPVLLSRLMRFSTNDSVIAACGRSLHDGRSAGERRNPDEERERNDDRTEEDNYGDDRDDDDDDERVFVAAGDSEQEEEEEEEEAVERPSSRLMRLERAILSVDRELEYVTQDCQRRADLLLSHGQDTRLSALTSDMEGERYQMFAENRAKSTFCSWASKGRVQNVGMMRQWIHDEVLRERLEDGKIRRHAATFERANEELILLVLAFAAREIVALWTDAAKREHDAETKSEDDGTTPNGTDWTLQVRHYKKAAQKSRVYRKSFRWLVECEMPRPPKPSP